MTRQYLAGELSVLFGRLQASTPDDTAVRAAGHLRRKAETTPPEGLGSVAQRALALAEVMCWESLERADAVTFARQAEISAELHQFGVCGGLLDEE